MPRLHTPPTQAADLQHMLSEMWQGFALVSALVLTMTYSTVDVWDVPSTVEFEDTVWGIGVNENTTDARRDALMSTAQSVHDILYCLTFTFSLIIVLVCLSGIEFSAMVPSTKLPAVVYDLGPIWMILPGNLLGVMGVTFTLSVIVKWSCAQTMTIFVINGSAILVFGVGIFLSWVLKLGVVINEVAEKKCSLEDEITTRGSRSPQNRAAV